LRAVLSHPVSLGGGIGIGAFVVFFKVSHGGFLLDHHIHPGGRPTALPDDRTPAVEDVPVHLETAHAEEDREAA
jgi:hypothetical protein